MTSFGFATLPGSFARSYLRKLEKCHGSNGQTFMFDPASNMHLALTRSHLLYRSQSRSYCSAEYAHSSSAGYDLVWLANVI